MKKSSFHFGKIWILLFIFIGLGFFVFVYDNPAKKNKKEALKFETPLFETFNKDFASEILIKSNTSEVRLIKEDSSWKLASKNNYPALSSQISEILSSITSLKKSDIASTKKESHDYFEVNAEKGIEVIISDLGKKEIAHFFLGKSGSPKWDDQYIRKDKDDTTYKVSGYLKGTFISENDQWLDKRLFALESDLKLADIAELKIVYGAESFLIQNDLSGLKIAEPDLQEIDQQKVESYIKRLNDFTALMLISKDDSSAKSYLSGGEKLYISLKKKDGRDVIIRFLSKDTDDDTSFYAEVSGNPYIFKTSKEETEKLMVKSEDIIKASVGTGSGRIN